MPAQAPELHVGAPEAFMVALTCAIVFGIILPRLVREWKRG